MITVSLMGLHLLLWGNQQKLKQTWTDLCLTKLPNGGAMLSFRRRSVALKALYLPWCGAPRPFQCPGTPLSHPTMDGWEWIFGEVWTSAPRKIRHDTLDSHRFIYDTYICVVYMSWKNCPSSIDHFFSEFQFPRKKKQSLEDPLVALLVRLSLIVTCLNSCQGWKSNCLRPGFSHRSMGMSWQVRR